MIHPIPFISWVLLPMLCMCLLSSNTVLAALYGTRDDSLREKIQQWLCETPSSCVKHIEAEPLPSLLRKVKGRLEDVRDSMMPNGPTPSLNNSAYPYFGFLPIYKGSSYPWSLIPMSFESRCFSRIIVSAKLSSSKDMLNISVLPLSQKSIACNDLLLFEGGGAYKLLPVGIALPYNIHMNVTLSEAELWYLETNGVRVFEFPGSLNETTNSVLQTLKLFSGFFLPYIPRAVVDANADFMAKYVQSSPRMQPAVRRRTGGSAVADSLDEKLIGSGDVLLIFRADGMDPMISWATGSTIGHVAITIRDPMNNNELLVCESTSSGAYWPVNGVQCNAWAAWIRMAKWARHNVLWLPLAPAQRAQFNAEAAMAFFRAYKGVDYGYSTFLFSWLDTQRDNFPCLPPNFTNCVSPETIEAILVIIDRVLGPVEHNVIREAFAHRVGQWPKLVSVIESMYAAFKTLKPWKFSSIYQIPEKDKWQYHTSRGYGPFQGGNKTKVISKSLVCSAFVCSMWKAGGLFNSVHNKLECAEQTPWDLYSMKLFDQSAMSDGRPAVCKETDPDNSLCQLMGDLFLEAVPDTNTRKVYANMGERCASTPPNYERARNC